MITIKIINKTLLNMVVITMFLLYIFSIIGIFYLLKTFDLWAIALLIMFIRFVLDYPNWVNTTHYFPFNRFFKHHYLDTSDSKKIEKLQARIDHLEHSRDGDVIGYEYLEDVYCVNDAPKRYTETPKFPIFSYEKRANIARCNACLELIIDVVPKISFKLINGIAKIVR